MRKSLTLSLVLISLGLFSCKKQILSNLEGSWAKVPIEFGEKIGDDGLIQADWEVWNFSNGEVSIAPLGGAVRYKAKYIVADLLVDAYLILSDMTKDGVPIKEANDKAYEQYQTKWTIVKLNNKRLVLFSQQSGGIQREFLRE